MTKDTKFRLLILLVLALGYLAVAVLRSGTLWD